MRKSGTLARRLRLASVQRVDRKSSPQLEWAPGRRRITAPALPSPYGNGITTLLRISKREPADDVRAAPGTWR